MSDTTEPMIEASSETSIETSSEASNTAIEANLEGNTSDNDTPPSNEQVLEAMKVVKDPEIPVNIVDLGLVYKCEVATDGVVDIEMTLTSVGCPVQDMIKADVELALMRMNGVKAVNVDFVWTPPWSTNKMTEDGKRQMRMFGFNV
jgi:metal-sulfur cluster biosynthetic enzyme